MYLQEPQAKWVSGIQPRWEERWAFAQQKTCTWTSAGGDSKPENRAHPPSLMEMPSFQTLCRAWEYHPGKMKPLPTGRVGGGRVGSLDGFGLIQLSRCLAVKLPCASFRSSTIIMGVKLIICLIETAFFQRTQKPVGTHCLTQPFNLPARQ